MVYLDAMVDSGAGLLAAGGCGLQLLSLVAPMAGSVCHPMEETRSASFVPPAVWRSTAEPSSTAFHDCSGGNAQNLPPCLLLPIHLVSSHTNDVSQAATRTHLLMSLYHALHLHTQRACCWTKLLTILIRCQTIPTVLSLSPMLPLSLAWTGMHT